MNLSCIVIKQELNKLADPLQAKILQSFFKTGKGEYGEGDIFIGIKMPILRKLVKKIYLTDCSEIIDLLHSKIHEERMTALLILVTKYAKGDQLIKSDIFNIFIDNTKWINNWDLVDVNVPKVIGTHLLNTDKSILYKFAGSNSLWERRISIVSTFTFIRNNQFLDTLHIAEILLNDKHDLIHKATGWMLREVGKRQQNLLEEFLNKNYTAMPRTMLRYAIEKFPEPLRLSYLNKSTK